MVRTVAAALAVLAALVPMTGVRFGGPTTGRAAELASVAAWAQLASVTPASGCYVGSTVEVRQDGYTVPGVEVGVALSLDGEVLSADRGVTDGDGIAYLGVDTGWAPPGREAWLDVLIGGDYAGGMPVTITEDGGCDDNPGLVEVTGAIPIAAQGVSGDGWGAGSAPATGGAVGAWVPTYVQQRNLSCEYAGLVIAMGAFGTWVSEYEFDERVGWSANPHWGFRGDITGWWGNTEDYGVYAEPLAAALEDFGFWGHVFYGQGDASELMAQLDAGHPTLVWVGLWGNTSFYEQTEDGTPYKLAAGQHVVVAYDYDDGGVYVSDPALGATRYYDWGTFMWMWNALDGMALAVGPY